MPNEFSFSNGFKNTNFWKLYNQMDLDYDNVRLKKNSYDKKLTILKERIKNYRIFKRKRPIRSHSDTHLS